MLKPKAVMRLFSVGEQAGAVEEPAAKRSWRIWLNRRIWDSFILVVGGAVVWIERVRPNRGYGARLASIAARVMMPLLGVRLHVKGMDRLQRGQAYVFTPNHQSPFDNAVLLATLPGARFAASREVFREPALAPPMRALGMIEIDRSDPKSAKRALDEAARRFGRKVSVVIYPEGDTGKAGHLAPFKSGPFVFAIQAQVPVVPVVIQNTRNIMAPYHLSIRGGHVSIEILEPISTEGLTFDDRSALKAHVQAKLAAALRDVYEVVPRGWAMNGHDSPAGATPSPNGREVDPERIVASSGGGSE
jgi:1-acyl-sn-glycerol-3-phosphate acyltransferase